jgi:hypothetical protein
MHAARKGNRSALAGFSVTLHTFRTAAMVGAVVGLMTWTCTVGAATADERDIMLATVRAYATAVYARDYAEAYRWIAAADRQLKSSAHYEQDNDPFKGASLTLARRLAQEIGVQAAEIDLDGPRAQVRVMLSLPNGNAEEVSRLLLREDGSAEAPTHELNERQAKLEALIHAGKVPRMEVEQTWTLVRDPEGWRVFLDWGSGIRIQFVTQVPEGLGVTAAFDRTEVLIPRGETVQLHLSVQNRSGEAFRLKAIHRVDPAALEKRLDLVQCGYLFPRHLAPGDKDQSPVIYFVDEDLPKDVEHLQVTLEFVAIE